MKFNEMSTEQITSVDVADLSDDEVCDLFEELSLRHHNCSLSLRNLCAQEAKQQAGIHNTRRSIHRAKLAKRHLGRALGVVQNEVHQMAPKTFGRYLLRALKGSLPAEQYQAIVDAARALQVADTRGE